MKQKKIIRLVIVGASGFGKEVAMTIESCIANGKNYELLGYIDEDKSLNHPGKWLSHDRYFNSRLVLF